MAEQPPFTIELSRVSHRFGYHWIFTNLSQAFESGKHYAVTGGNGAGKSTLMRILAGALMPARGKVEYSLSGQPIQRTAVYRYLSYAAPYMELIEEYRVEELMNFQRRFKPYIQLMENEQLLEIIQLPPSATRNYIRAFSSGMKQRLQLGLALLANTPLVLLDEPTSNLDAQGIRWYHDMLATYTPHRLVVIASNVPDDYRHCDTVIELTATT